MSERSPNNNQNSVLNSCTVDESVNFMKNLIVQYKNIGLYSNALFYADKIFFLSLNKDLSTISEHLYELSHCFYLNKEYFRCVNLIQKYNMTYYNLKFLNLLGQALMSCEDYDSVITYLDKDNLVLDKETSDSESLNLLQSIRHFIIGKSYEMQENKTPAIRHYIMSLNYDPGNVEVFELLINHNLLSSEQKYKIMNELQFSKMNKWLYDYYLSKTLDNIYMTDKSDIIIEEERETKFGNIIDILYRNNDQDLMKIEAEKFFGTRDYFNAYMKLKKINDEDFYKLDIVPMYCSCMIELDKVGEIYYLAHKLANTCPEKYVSWFAVVY